MHSHIRPAQHYAQLLARLSPSGNYQLRLTALMITCWILSGLTQAIHAPLLAPRLGQLAFFV